MIAGIILIDVAGDERPSPSAPEPLHFFLCTERKNYEA